MTGIPLTMQQQDRSPQRSKTINNPQLQQVAAIRGLSSRWPRESKNGIGR